MRERCTMGSVRAFEGCERVNYNCPERQRTEQKSVRISQRLSRTGPSHIHPKIKEVRYFFCIKNMNCSLQGLQFFPKLLAVTRLKNACTEELCRWLIICMKNCQALQNISVIFHRLKTALKLYKLAIENLIYIYISDI